jgi:hypothetical protein
MTRNKAIGIMKNHGLYCNAIGNDGIALTDNKGNVYDIVFVTAKGLIIDENTTMSLLEWLGY